MDNLVDCVTSFSKLSIRDLGTNGNSIILNLYIYVRTKNYCIKLKKHYISNLINFLLSLFPNFPKFLTLL